jgi:ectoine hydroxylase-related dioxygenase (phytanoyl-CoA dioxygenase family)
MKSGGVAMLESERATFRTHGYVIVRSLIAAERRRALTATVSELIERAAAGKISMKFADAEKRIPIRGFLFPALLDPDLKARVFADWLNVEIAPLVKFLLEAEARCTELNMLFAGGGKSVKLGWHRDAGGSSDDDEDAAIQRDLLRTCGFLAPLKFTDTFHELVPGSHNRPLTLEEAEARINPKKEMPGAIRISLELGDVLLRHAYSLHRGMNRTGADRWTISGQFWRKD